MGVKWVERILDAPGLYHVTVPSNLSGIQTKGLLSPRQARENGARKGLGSNGSNIDVVQLIDTQLGHSEAARGLLNGLESDFFMLRLEHGRMVVLRIDEALRKHDGFICHHDVRRDARKMGFRYYQEVEVWFNGTVPPSLITVFEPDAK